MRPNRILTAAVFLLSGCSSGQPVPVTSGPKLEARLAATWPATGPARQVAFSRDGQRAAFSDAAGQITIRETGGWHSVGQLRHPNGATTVAFSADGTHLFSGGYDGVLREWDLASGKLVRGLSGAHGAVWTLDVAPDGKSIAAAGEDKIIRIWPLQGSAKPLLLHGHDLNIWEVRFSPDGTRLASGSFDKTVRLWDAGSGRLLRTMSGHSEGVVGVEFSPDGRTIASGADDSTIRFWNAADATPLRTLDNSFHVDKLAFSPDGQWLASGGHARGTVAEVWHELTGFGGDGPSVRIRRVSDGALVANLDQPEDVIWVSFSRDGRWLVASGEDKRFYLWRLKPARA